MDKREIDMYRIEDAVKAILDNTPIKQIARQQKISKNTVKKYRRNFEAIRNEKPWLTNIDEIMEEFRSSRNKERYSENHGWIERNTELVDELSTRCDNYVRLFQVLQEKGSKGSKALSLFHDVSDHNLRSVLQHFLRYSNGRGKEQPPVSMVEALQGY